MGAMVGSEALRAGRLTRGQLRWNYTAVHPDVYVANDTERTLAVNTEAAALWVPCGVGSALPAKGFRCWIPAPNPRGRRGCGCW